MSEREKERKKEVKLTGEQCSRFSKLWMKFGCNVTSSKIKAAEPQKTSKREQRALNYKLKSHIWKLTFSLKNTK